MIQLRINGESDLYNPYDPSCSTIHEGVYRYLKSFCSELEYQKHMHDTLQIVTDSPIDEDRFRAALQKAVKADLDEFDRQFNRNRRRMIWEYIVGFGLSILGIALSIFLDQVLMAIISFLGSSAISNAVTIKTTVNHDLKHLKSLLDPCKDLKVEVVLSGDAEAGSSGNETRGQK